MSSLPPPVSPADYLTVCSSPSHVRPVVPPPPVQTATASTTAPINGAALLYDAVSGPSAVSSFSFFCTSVCHRRKCILTETRLRQDGAAVAADTVGVLPGEIEVGVPTIGYKTNDNGRHLYRPIIVGVLPRVIAYIVYATGSVLLLLLLGYK